MAVSMTWPQYQRRECTACGFKVRLSEMQAEILLVLLLRYPGPVPVPDMIEAAWHDAQWRDPDAEPSSAYNTVQLTLQHLRAKIGGFHIHGRRTYGYRLVQHPGD